MKNIILIVVLQTLLVGAVGAGGWFMGKASTACPAGEGGEGAAAAGGAAADQPDPIFTELDPLVMNIRDGDRRRFMQVQITTKSFDQAAVDAVDKFSPRIRGELLDAFSTFTADQASSPEGREAMATKAKETLNMVLAEEAGITDGVAEVYLPKLVIQ